MSAGQDLRDLRDPPWNPTELDEAHPTGRSLPVRWEQDRTDGHPSGAVGGVDEVVRAQAYDPGFAEPEPDAVARGWVADSGAARSDALFVLAGRAIGVGRHEEAGGTVWLDLDDLVNLDAIGDPRPAVTGGEPVQQVELRMTDGSTLEAEWPLGFCDAVVGTLQRLAGQEPAPEGPALEGRASEDSALEDSALEDSALEDLGPATSNRPDVRFDEIAPEPAPGPEPAPSPVFAPAEAAPEAPAPAAQAAAAPIFQSPQPAAAPAPRTASGVRPGTLELEDVVYLGGYPGHHKKRKKCTATLSREGFEVAGPGDLHFRLAWDAVRTIEVQNSDEARFRMNAKIHRDASALVIECDQGVTVVLEARDCPTIALRSAIGQLMTDLPVVVV